MARAVKQRRRQVDFERLVIQQINRSGRSLDRCILHELGRRLVCPGAIDMVNFGPLETVPEQFRSRNLHIHNSSVTLMRTTPEECAEIGRTTAVRLNGASGPVTVLIPLQGVSAIDRAGGPFYSEEALTAYRLALKAELNSNIRVVELDAHINDGSFARTAADLLIESLHTISTSRL